MTDWLVAIDDALCERLTHCTLCGRPSPIWFAIWASKTLAVGYALCQRCHSADPQRTHLDGKLRARYANWRPKGGAV